jgi:hypothetical protein
MVEEAGVEGSSGARMQTGLYVYVEPVSHHVHDTKWKTQNAELRLAPELARGARESEHISRQRLRSMRLSRGMSALLLWAANGPERPDWLVGDPVRREPVSPTDVPPGIKEPTDIVKAKGVIAWDEIREKTFKNYALKSMDVVQAKLNEAILYIERNPKLVRSITSFPYIVKSL